MEANVAGPWPDPEIPTNDNSGRMVPPWVKYPNLPRRSMGWRMGTGEHYRDQFRTWWAAQNRGEFRLKYQADYPEPAEWEGFLSDRS